jgi:hypothetical protein
MSEVRMLLQVWDEELAAVAQRWADKCTLAHDGTRDVSEYHSNSSMIPLFDFLCWGETESTWHVSHYLAYCTSPGRWMMNVEQSVE